MYEEIRAVQQQIKDVASSVEVFRTDHTTVEKKHSLQILEAMTKFESLSRQFQAQHSLLDSRIDDFKYTHIQFNLGRCSLFSI